MNKFDAASYSIVVTKALDHTDDQYFAYVKEIPDISSYGETFKEVYDDCVDALSLLYEEAISNGKDFPLPYKSPSPSMPSGRVTLRMSRSLHAEIVRCAEEDGISQNQWIIEAISQRRGFQTAKKSSPKLFNNITSMFSTNNNHKGYDELILGSHSLLMSSSDNDYATIGTD